MQEYNTRIDAFEQELKISSKNDRWYVIVRVITILCFIVFGFFFSRTIRYEFLFLSLSCLLIFFIVMRFHKKILHRIDLLSILLQINKNELNVLNGEKNRYDNGSEFNIPGHSFSFDLDFFGEASLYQYLNRCGTYPGRHFFATYLCDPLSSEQIVESQLAIKELAAKVNFRQDVLAFGIKSEDSKKSYSQLVNWLHQKSLFSSRVANIIIWISPIFLILSFFIYLSFDVTIFWKICSSIFIFNLFYFSTFAKKIQLDLSHFETAVNQLEQYRSIFQKIESENFESKLLKQLQGKLVDGTYKASTAISQLSSYIDSLHTMLNLPIAVLLNGIFLFHVRKYLDLLNWKQSSNANFVGAFEVIGRMEALNSLANFSFNNPAYVFSEINDRKIIRFHDLGHPLISEKVRVTNSIDFDRQRFMILSGSNMSGKSTFLRTLGVNFILARIGAPVCASHASIHPMDVWVSMRLADSLAENESYFFAEVKRLKEIVTATQMGNCFILLDEILRGTNSDDKQNGTIEVIKKLMSNHVIGALATHDIEVCQMTEDYGSVLFNKCFEVDILEDNLYFDYRLRDGICKNRSASFLMKKMEII